MGVADVIEQAVALGFSADDTSWANLGQGQPESGPISGAPPRLGCLPTAGVDLSYGPVAGIPELREAVADYYNRTFRRGRASQYKAENVAIAQGGRLALTRALLGLESVNVGYQVPDYPAFGSMLAMRMPRVVPHGIETHEEQSFELDLEELEARVRSQGLQAFLLSNPCNPTGQSLRGARLGSLVRICRRWSCRLFVDEFYSNFSYQRIEPALAVPAQRPISASEYVDDVNRDPVLIFDGLTKGFRYPGLRLGWAVAPRAMIERIVRLAAELDGGPSVPVQRAALNVLARGNAELETHAVRHLFCEKRNEMVASLSAMGVSVPVEPDSTFYVWACLKHLPMSVRDAQAFVHAALARRVITLPGELFDINPGGRGPRSRKYGQWIRLSFGPRKEEIGRGLRQIRRLIHDASTVAIGGEKVQWQSQ